jgi:hypothetical protein
VKIREIRGRTKKHQSCLFI